MVRDKAASGKESFQFSCGSVHVYKQNETFLFYSTTLRQKLLKGFLVSTLDQSGMDLVEPPKNLPFE